MDKKTIKGRISRFFKFIYLKLFRMNDTPQRIAIGCALGVFFGIMPGMGPLVALFFALILKMNRASALLGSILTNTWLSIVTFLLAVRLGSIATGANYTDIQRGWTSLIRNFKCGALFELSFYKIIMPIVVGYIIIALFVGLLAYILTLIVIAIIKYRRKGHIYV